MAKIGAQPAAGALTGAEKVPLVQGGITKRSTTAAIAALGAVLGIEGAEVLAQIYAAYEANDGASQIGYQPDLAQALPLDIESDLNAASVSIFRYIPKSLHAAVRAGTDITDHTPYLQKMHDDGLRAVRLGRGTFNGNTPLAVTHNFDIVGESRSATKVKLNYNGTWCATAASGRRVMPMDISFEGDPANPLTRAFDLFDAATYPFVRVTFVNCRGGAFRLVQAVQVGLHNVTTVNCGTATSSTVTVSIANPGIVTWNGHGLAAGTRVVLTTTNALPTGLIARNRAYYVVNPTANNFQLALAPGGAAIVTTGVQAGTHTAYGCTKAAIDIDPGVTSSVQVALHGCYLAASGIALLAPTCRKLYAPNTTIESNVIGIVGIGIDGSSDDSFFEANILDGILRDSPDFKTRGLSSTNGERGNWQIEWAASPLNRRRILVDVVEFGELQNGGVNDRHAGQYGAAIGAWWPVEHDNVGVHLNCSPKPGGGNPDTILLGAPGDREIAYGVLFRDTGGGGGNGAIRLMADYGAGYVEVPFSCLRETLASNESKWVTGSVIVPYPLAAGKIRMEASVNDLDIYISSTGVTGTGAATQPLNAFLKQRHLGTMG